jgi:hypothetical protein
VKVVGASGIAAFNLPIKDRAMPSILRRERRERPKAVKDEVTARIRILVHPKNVTLWIPESAENFSAERFLRAKTAISL